MNTKINQEERAFRAWTVLTKYAQNKKSITYKELGEKLEVHHRTCRFFLDHIQDYCMDNKLPPLTIIVVNQEGKVGDGFIAWDTSNFEEGKSLVFEYNWNSYLNPFFYARDGETAAEIVEKIIQGKDEIKEIFSKVKARGIIQSMFREALLKVYNKKCAFCGFPHEAALEASHIIPWAQCSNEEKISINNGILLCSNHQKLFDSGFLRISENYIIEACIPFKSNILGKRIRLPKLKEHFPALAYIEKRRQITLT